MPYGFYTGPQGLGIQPGQNQGINTRAYGLEGGTQSGYVPSPSQANVPTAGSGAPQSNLNVPVAGKMPTNPNLSQLGQQGQGFGVPQQTPQWLADYVQQNQGKNTGEAENFGNSTQASYQNFQNSYGQNATPFAYKAAGTDLSNPSGGGLGVGSYDWLKDYNRIANTRGDGITQNQIFAKQGYFNADNGSIQSPLGFDPLGGRAVSGGQKFGMQSYGVGQLDPTYQPSWNPTSQVPGLPAGPQNIYNQLRQAQNPYGDDPNSLGYQQSNAYQKLMNNYQQYRRYVPDLKFSDYVASYNKQYGGDSSRLGTGLEYQPNSYQDSGQQPIIAQQPQRPGPLNPYNPNQNDY